MSQVLQWHVTWSTRGRQPIAPDEARRRALVRAVVERAGAALVLFSVVDDHLHLWLIGEREILVQIVRSVGYALRVLGPTEPHHIREVERRSHADWLVTYLLTQPTHHGLSVHPAAWTGGCVADLLGARMIGSWRSRIWDALPRFRLRDVHAAVGLPTARLQPCDDASLAERGAEGLLTLAAAALAAEPDLTSRGEANVLAVAATAQLGRTVGIPPSAIAAHAGRTREAVSRAASRGVAAPMLLAVRRRVSLELCLEEITRRTAPAAELASAAPSGSCAVQRSRQAAAP